METTGYSIMVHVRAETRMSASTRTMPGHSFEAVYVGDVALLTSMDDLRRLKAVIDAHLDGAQIAEAA